MRGKVIRIAAVLAMCIYLVAVIYLVLLPFPSGPWFRKGGQPPLGWSWHVALNLIPFREYDARQIIGNLELGVPFGVLLPMIVGWRPRWLVVSCVVFGCVPELAQVGFGLAYGALFRSVDITDALMNIAGALLGLGALLLLARSLPWLRPAAPLPMPDSHLVGPLG